MFKIILGSSIPIYTWLHFIICGPGLFHMLHITYEYRQIVLYILTGSQVLGIVYLLDLDHLSGAHHTHISYYDTKTNKNNLNIFYEAFKFNFCSFLYHISNNNFYRA